jgi:hypothetical protein
LLDGVVMKLRQPRYWVYGFILVIGLVNLISYTDFSRDATRHAASVPGDARYYIAMSRHTLAHVPNPYAFRLLSPFIVHELQKLPLLGLSSSWLLLTFVATNLAIIVFFNLLYDHFKLSLFTSTVFAVMLACTYNYSLYNYTDIWLVDPVNNLVYVLAFYFAVTRKLVAFMVTVLIGSINKETAVMLAPLYPVLDWVRTGQWKSREVARSSAAAVIVIGLYLGYHAVVMAKLGSAGYQFGSGVNGHSVMDNIRFSLSLRKNVEQLAIFQVFQFLWFVFAYGLYRLYKAYGVRSELLAVSAYFLLVVIVGRMFATDTERVYVMLAPAVLGISALIYNGFRTEQQRLWVALVAFAYLVLNFQWLSGDTSILLNLAVIVVFILALEPTELDFRRVFALPNN